VTRKHTLTIASRILTEPKTALAGVMLEISFARFMASIAIFNEERFLSFPSDRWGLVSIVETQRGGENPVLREAVRKSTALRKIGDRLSHVQIA